MEKSNYTVAALCIGIAIGVVSCMAVCQNKYSADLRENYISVKKVDGVLAAKLKDDCTLADTLDGTMPNAYP